MICALVPVKNLSLSKSRLARVLSQSRREELSAYMLHRVLQTLHESRRFAALFLVTNDPRAAQIGEKFAARVIGETEQVSENQSIARGTRYCRAQGFAALLVLPADLPLITAADIEEILAVPPKGPGVILCPSKEGTGTNALYRTPADVIPSCFGPNSFHRHVQEANRLKIPCASLSLHRIAFDIDTAGDLREWQRMNEPSRAYTEPAFRPAI